MKITHISKSTKAAFERCPWKIDQHKNHGVPEVIGPKAQVGIDTHEYYRSYRLGGLTYDQIDTKIKDPEVAVLVKAAIALEPQPENHDEAMEMHVLLDLEGQVASIEEANFEGYLDRVIFSRDDDGNIASIEIVDLKSGWWVEDDRFERDLYSWMIYSLFPTCDIVTFTRLYCRLGKLFRWDYAKTGPDDYTVTPYSTGKAYQVNLHKRVVSAYTWIANTEPLPKPGGHCSNWYGSPCWAYGSKCPLFNEVSPSLDAPLMVTDGPSAKERLLKVANAKAEALTDADISWAWAGIDQIDGFLTRVKKRIKDWSRANGPFTVGDDVYGWHTVQKREVNKELALTIMLGQGMTMAEIAKVVSIAPTSIETKVSKRTLADVREMLIDTTIEVSKEKVEFGQIKDVNRGEGADAGTEVSGSGHGEEG